MTASDIASRTSDKGVRRGGAAVSGRPNRSLVGRILYDFRRQWQLWVMVLPAVGFVGLFAYGPMYGIQLAFRDFDPLAGLTGGKFAGMKYFNQYFNSPLFWETLVNTFRVAGGTLVLGFIFPIILALLINQIGSKKIKGFVQTITYMPHFISTVVVVSMLNIFLSPNSGLIGRFTGASSLLDYPGWFAPLYWISEVWQHVGWNAIIYLAALSSVDLALYEAAKVDGANRLQLIRNIDLPTIMPTCVILLIMNLGSVLGVGFEKVYLMQNTMNLPASEVISTYTYKMGMIGFQYSFGTAIGLFNTVVNLAMLLIANFVANKVSETSIF